MRLSIISATLVLGLILAVIFRRGIGALTWEMLTQAPQGSFYLGGGGGGAPGGGGGMPALWGLLIARG